MTTNQGVESSWGVRTHEAVIFECPYCGLRFRTPAPPATIEEFYEAGYHDRMVGRAEDEARRVAYRRENEARIRFLQAYCPRGRVLDIGCSTGVFASQLKDSGFEALGSDISLHACKEASRLLGDEKVFSGPIESFGVQLEGSLDGITMMDVIEHFEDVVQPLVAMRRMLKPGGVLFLRTPTLSSPFYRVADLSYRLSSGLYEDAVLKIYHAEHFFFFTEKSMKLLLEETGYDLLAIEPDPLLWDNFRSAELREGAVGNAVLAGVYFLGRLVRRGHGMRVIARRAA